MIEMQGYDFYGKYTDVDGKVMFVEHRVTDTARFAAHKAAEAKQANDRQKPGEPRLAAFEQITREAYRAATGRR